MTDHLTEPVAGVGITETDALQVIELLLRPGPGQCADPSVAHVVVRAYLDRLGIAPLPEGVQKHRTEAAGASDLLTTERGNE